MSDVIKLDDLTIFNAAATKETLSKALESDNCELDFSEVGEVDTSGLQLLIALKKQADAEDKTVDFSSLSEPVKELVEQYSMQEFFGLSA